MVDPLLKVITGRDVEVAHLHKLQARGVRHPALVVCWARRRGLPLALACAMLELETGGGRNVYGHDPVSTGGTYVKGGRVTQTNYQAFRRWQRAGPGRMQGVGPTQLTWHTYQDEADRLGGCWRPSANIAVGFRVLASAYRSSRSLVGAGQRYNGSLSYGFKFAAAVARWRARFASDRAKAKLGRRP